MTSSLSTRLSTLPPPRSSGSGRGRRAMAAVRRRNRLVESHHELVRPVALHYARRCQESWEDLLQVGQLGLIRAAELYCADLGTPFAAFARPHIRGAILHYLRDEAQSVRLPRRQAELQERLQRLEGEQGPVGPGGAEVTAAHLRRQLGIDDERWGLLVRHRQLSRPLPLEEARLEELAAPEAGDGSERLEAIRELVGELEARQRQVVQRVVLGGWSYRRLAAKMQVSPMTVQRLLHRALARLRHQLEERELRWDQPAHRVGSGLRGY